MGPLKICTDTPPLWPLPALRPVCAREVGVSAAIRGRDCFEWSWACDRACGPWCREIGALPWWCWESWNWGPWNFFPLPGQIEACPKAAVEVRVVSGPPERPETNVTRRAPEESEPPRRPLGAPRIGDVSPVPVEQVVRRIEVTYQVAVPMAAGSRLNVLG
ncbi:MAG: hypothetical protein KF745_06180 [Phycisphaeraceae bacterium]|nr:hypothetical protein [Phycisphaeraceae bacterium]